MRAVIRYVLAVSFAVVPACSNSPNYMYQDVPYAEMQVIDTPAIDSPAPPDAGSDAAVTDSRNDVLDAARDVFDGGALDADGSDAPADNGTCDASGCPSVSNAHNTCSTTSGCGFECNTGYADCDGIAGNGCETNTGNDRSNCGSCGSTCSGATNAMAVCIAGTCALQCTGGYTDCDHMASNGCETNTTSDPSACGTCTTVCPVAPNAAATCSGGTCGLACNSGFGDCDGSSANGCETDVASDPNNCGACRTVCPASMPLCVSGRCAAPMDAGADAGDAASDAEAGVVDTGMCDPSICPTVANAQRTCSTDTGCGFVCNTGFADCDGIAANGCEVNVYTDRNNCNGCNVVCSGATNASPVCVGGTCEIMCSGGYSDCDHDVTNGCETNTSTDPNACGTCTTVCTGATNANPVCSGGTCAISCQMGWANCDGSTANGCETAIGGDSSNCGNCGVICPPSAPNCRSGVCGA